MFHAALDVPSVSTQVEEITNWASAPMLESQPLGILDTQWAELVVLGAEKST